MKLLVCCRTQILLVDTKTREVKVVQPATDSTFYGMSWFPDGQGLYIGYTGVLKSARDLHGRINAERGWIGVGDRTSDAILAEPHQIHCADDTIITAHTGRNCLTLFRREDMFYRHHWLDDVRWDRLESGNDCGSHFNSVMVRGRHLYVVAHNFDRGSYVLVLSWPDMQLERRIPCSALWAHNVWPRDDGSLVVCDSRYSRLVEAVSGKELWCSGEERTITRGLGCRDGVVFVGRSEMLDPDRRHDSSGGIWIIDQQSWKTLDYIDLPNSGPVQELRVVEGDECHNGFPLRTPIPIDERATEEYLALMRLPSVTDDPSKPRRVAVASLPFAASWQSASEKGLSQPWSLRGGFFSPADGALRPAQRTTSLASLEGITEANVSVSAHVDVTTSQMCYAGVVARYRGAGDGNAYLAMLVHRHPQFALELWKSTGTNWVLMRSIPAPSSKGVLGLQVHDQVLGLYFDGVLQHWAEDADITAAGSVGIRACGGRIRDFSARRLLLPPEFPVQTDSPSVAPPLAKRPLRIGMWCDFGKTLTPHEGIGVFAHNLAEGLLNQPEPVELTMVVHTGEAHVMDGLRTKAPDRVQVLPEGNWQPQTRQRVFHLLHRWISTSDRIQQRLKSWSETLGTLKVRLRGWAINTLRRLPSQKLRLAAGAAALALTGPALWLMFMITGLLGGLVRGATAPLAIADRWARRRWRRPDLLNAASYRELIQRADCDVWIIPYVGFEYPIDFPAVVFIHDLVIYHYPELFDSTFVEHLKRIVPQRAAEATICACMSEFIRQKDLLGVLQLSPDKVRMVRPAAPGDMVTATVAESPAGKRPYLFYPAAFRGYKNHRALILALHTLQNQFGDNKFDVVFTGPNVGEMPADLDALARQLGVRDRIHVTGRVDRPTLASLYKGAFAVVVPSLYEQGSFPVYEALAAGVPVACSDIPALQEMCGPLGGTMLYFDPLDATNLAQTIRQISTERDDVLRRQQVAAPALWKRTWTDAAGEWLPVLHDAANRWKAKAAAPAVRQSPAAHTAPAPGDPYRVLLFLPKFYAGGVWQTVKDLVRTLDAVNRDRGQLEIKLGLSAEQYHSATRELGDELSLCVVELMPTEPAPVTGSADPLVSTQAPKSVGDCFFDLGDADALHAEAWVALSDRFEMPLRRARPYGVFVYDMIQRHAPEGYPDHFFRLQSDGIAPTLRAADRVFVTSPATQTDVREEFGIDSGKLQLIPVACEPHVRFEKLPEEELPLPRTPFILNVTNSSRHKGMDVLLPAYRRLKDSQGADCPLLVVCGFYTEQFSARNESPGGVSYWREIREMVKELGLREDEDVVFLGHVTDGQLKFLFERCSAVVNAARYDNGSFSVIEGRYFGKPTVSTDYPASRFLYERFGIPVHFAPVTDAEALAQGLQLALQEQQVTGAELTAVREQLATPSLGYRNYAECFYDQLVQLAKQGRDDGAIKSAA